MAGCSRRTGPLIFSGCRRVGGAGALRERCNAQPSSEMGHLPIESDLHAPRSDQPCNCLCELYQHPSVQIPMMSPTHRRINSATSSGSETLLFPSTEPRERLSMESAVQDRRQRSYPFVFATTGGVRPFCGFSKAKLAPDKHIAELGNSESRDPMRRGAMICAGPPKL